MGYTKTTNYGFQKPNKENTFTIDDLNNALDKIDNTIKTRDKAQNTKNSQQDANISKKVSINQGTNNSGKVLGIGEDGNVTPISLTSEGVSKVDLTKSNGSLTIKITNPDGSVKNDSVMVNKSEKAIDLNSLITIHNEAKNNYITVNFEFDIQYIFMNMNSIRSTRVTVSKGTYKDVYSNNNVSFTNNTRLGIASLDNFGDCHILTDNDGTSSVYVAGHKASRVSAPVIDSTGNKYYYTIYI